MKKNVMMRVASILLVLVLMSTSAISGTFAKYVTTADGADTARVAKFGVEVAVAGGLFSETYVAVADGNIPGSTNLTVESSNDDKLVAPGTQNDDGLTFKITGTPEVKVNVSISIDDATRKDVYLKKADGKYLNWTTGNDTTDKFNLANNYHPILYTLWDGNGAPVSGCQDVNILTIENYLENTLSKDYPAGTNLATALSGNVNGTFKLTWKWNFLNGLDEADTLLGNLAVDSAKFGPDLAADDYNLGAHIDLTVTVTQVD